ERRARVEAEPAEPQDQHAEHRQRHRVARDRVRLALRVELAYASAEHERAGEGCRGAAEVHDRRAREVLHAALGEEAAAPDPVPDERVDEGGEDDREDDVDAELRAVEHRAPDDREADGAEDHLEQELRRERHVGERQRAEGGAVEEESVGSEHLVAVAEGQGEAHGPEGDRSDREVDEDLGDDGADVLAAREADFEHREAGLHQEHHATGDDDPDRVDGELELFWRHTRLLSWTTKKAAPKFGNGFIAYERATSPALIHMVQQATERVK